MEPAKHKPEKIGQSSESRVNKSQFDGWRSRYRQLPLIAAGSKIMDSEHHNTSMNADVVGNNNVPVPPSAQEKSVVGPLMGVFEDLIKSSTPQVPPLPPINNGGGKRGSATIDSGNRQMRSKKPRYNDADNTTAPKRRKGKTSSDDVRWSKRFTWPDELHREFVSAIFDVGLKHSSPSAIMEFMRPNSNITSERVKSHLQKYRKNRDKSRREFMTSYDNSLIAFKNQSGEEYDDNDNEDRVGLTFGEAAAFCTHAVASGKNGTSGSYDSATSSRRSSPVPMNDSGLGTLQLPVLSVEERNGPLGQSFDCLMGLFQSLSQQLEASRNAATIPSAQTSSQYTTQQHSHQQSSLPVEQAVAVATSTIHPSDPSFHQVADTIPHSLSEPPPISHHRRQAQTEEGYPKYANHAQKQPSHYQSHVSNEIPSIPYSPPRLDHVAGTQVQAQMAASMKQYHGAPQDQHAAQKSHPPLQHSASTTKAQKESTIMKQEMRGQRAFQTKIRAMMQNEMNKYGGNEHGAHGAASGGDNDGHALEHSDPQPQAGNDNHSPSMTYQPDNNFWNIDNDDEIFDFLMQS